VCDIAQVDEFPEGLIAEQWKNLSESDLAERIQALNAAEPLLNLHAFKQQTLTLVERYALLTSESRMIAELGSKSKAAFETARKGLVSLAGDLRSNSGEASGVSAENLTATGPSKRDQKKRAREEEASVGNPQNDLEKVYKSISAAVVGPLVEPHDHKTHQTGASTAAHCC
jgi:hypothetical protein